MTTSPSSAGMAMDAETLKGLLERVRAETRTNRLLDAEIYCASAPLGERWRPMGPPGGVTQRLPLTMRGWDMSLVMTGSVTAAAIRIREALPGSTWAVFSDGTAWVWLDASMDLLKGHQGKAATPELALCAALLTALIARAETDGGRDA